MPYGIVEEFEKEIAEYVGAPYAVAVDSCTNGIFLCFEVVNIIAKKLQFKTIHDLKITIPNKTYCSIPQSIMRAGYDVEFSNSMNDWQGMYQLGNTTIFDSAKQLTPGMYVPGTTQVISMHIKKPLAVGKGGVIFTDRELDVSLLKRLRYEGRRGVDYQNEEIDFLGYNHYLMPELAARARHLLSIFPKDGIIQEKENYPELSKFKVFKNVKVID